MENHSDPRSLSIFTKAWSAAKQSVANGFWSALKDLQSAPLFKGAFQEFGITVDQVKHLVRKIKENPSLALLDSVEGALEIAAFFIELTARRNLQFQWYWNPVIQDFEQAYTDPSNPPEEQYPDHHWVWQDDQWELLNGDLINYQQDNNIQDSPLPKVPLQSLAEKLLATKEKQCGTSNMFIIHAGINGGDSMPVVVDRGTTAESFLVRQSRAYSTSFTGLYYKGEEIRDEELLCNYDGLEIQIDGEYNNVYCSGLAELTNDTYTLSVDASLTLREIYEEYPSFFVDVQVDADHALVFISDNKIILPDQKACKLPDSFSIGSVRTMKIYRKGQWHKFPLIIDEPDFQQVTRRHYSCDENGFIYYSDPIDEVKLCQPLITVSEESSNLVTQYLPNPKMEVTRKIPGMNYYYGIYIASTSHRQGAKRFYAIYAWNYEPASVTTQRPPWMSPCSKIEALSTEEYTVCHVVQDAQPLCENFEISFITTDGIENILAESDVVLILEGGSDLMC